MVVEHTSATLGPIELASVPQVRSDTAVLAVAGQPFASTADGALHTFEDEAGGRSEVGERIVGLIDGRRSINDIVEVLLAEFEVARDVAEADTLSFIRLLAERQVVSF